MMLQLLLHALIYAQIAAAGTSTVALPYGTFQGLTTGNVTQFLGVPFAQAARFRTPKEPALLRGVQNATSFGPACPQQRLSPIPDVAVGSTYPSVSEDCLSLNVFGPTIRGRSSELPVFVWIHGGGFEVGSSRDYDLPPVVEQSIKMAQPVIVQSGAAVHIDAQSDGQSDYDNLVAAVNCTGPSDSLNCLRLVPFDTLMAAINNTADIFSYRSLNLAWAPRIDGDIIERDPWSAISAGMYAKIPMLVGMSDDEGTLFSLSTLNITTDTGFMGYVRSRWVAREFSNSFFGEFWRNSYFPEASADQMTQIPSLYPSDPTQVSDFLPIIPEHDLQFSRGLSIWNGYRERAHARIQATGRNPRRHVDNVSTTILAGTRIGNAEYMGLVKTANGPLGAYHGSDTPIWFTTNSSAGTEGINALINFINTLDPNMSATNSSQTNSLSVPWPEWNSTAVSDDFGVLLTFGDNGTNITAEDFRLNAVNFLNELRLEEANTGN
ncbi:Carboxylic ester hydrolase [Mycena sanguinolenta]|uniref:Carboxylic ester hydrolase n=1 Tax=Mycena sanguinolenta TaxID=230812 RepID=A0A8H7DKJ9_9AGAR|nr:Carboxylic ester hydrolase [Mycena sanguinolenta]